MNLNDLAYRAIASAFGAPVDLTTMALRPLGYKAPDQNVVGGSEWIGQKMQDLGLVSSARNPNAEMLASMLVPGPGELAGVAKGGLLALGTLKGLPKFKYRADISKYAEDDLLDYVTSIRKTPGSTDAKEEAVAAVLSGANNKFVVYDGGKVAGAVAYHVDDADKTIFIDHIGSLQKGTGREMMEEIEKSMPDGYKMILVPSESGKGFWQKLGFTDTERGSLMQKQVRQLKESDYYYHGTPIHNAASIGRTGLSPGLSGMTGLTQEGPKAAQDWAKAMQRGQVKGEKDVALVRVRKDAIQPDLVDRGEVFVRNGVPPELIEISLDGGKTWSKATK